MSLLQNILGVNNIRLANYPVLSAHILCCFFEADGSTALKPLDTITDFCDTWDLDGSGDIMPEVTPGSSGCWDIDSNGDIMPEAV